MVRCAATSIVARERSPGGVHRPPHLLDPRPPLDEEPRQEGGDVLSSSARNPKSLSSRPLSRHQSETSVLHL